MPKTGVKNGDVKLAVYMERLDSYIESQTALNQTLCIRLEKLDEINKIDRRMKRKKVRENEDETNKLLSRRNTLRQQLKK